MRSLGASANIYAMKKSIYIFLSGVLGVILATIIHGLVEIWYINLLLSDFPKYGFGFSWNTWVIIHNVLSGILWVTGLLVGIQCGFRWWNIIYVEKRYPWRKLPWFKNYKPMI